MAERAATLAATSRHPPRLAALIKSYRPADLADVGFKLYEQFRPSVPEGVEGWGAEGVLDLVKIRALASHG